jgi:hypothetical protein
MQLPRAKHSKQGSARPWVLLALVGVAALAAWWLAMTPPAVLEQVSAPPSGAAGEQRTLAPADPSKPAEQASPLTGEQRSPSPSPRTDEQQRSAAGPEPEVAQHMPAANTPAVPTRQGPVDALAKRFAGESRGASSETEDARVRAAFSDPAIPTDMLRTVECRRSVCRAELRWSAQHDAAYVLGLTRAVGTFSAPLGVEEAGAPDGDGARPLVVYFGLTR